MSATLTLLKGFELGLMASAVFSEQDKEWFFARGGEWLKVEAEAGDLILWSSA